MTRHSGCMTCLSLGILLASDTTGPWHPSRYRQIFDSIERRHADSLSAVEAQEAGSAAACHWVHPLQWLVLATAKEQNLA